MTHASWLSLTHRLPCSKNKQQLAWRSSRHPETHDQHAPLHCASILPKEESHRNRRVVLGALHEESLQVERHLALLCPRPGRIIDHLRPKSAVGLSSLNWQSLTHPAAQAMAGPWPRLQSNGFASESLAQRAKAPPLLPGAATRDAPRSTKQQAFLAPATAPSQSARPLPPAPPATPRLGTA